MSRVIARFFPNILMRGSQNRFQHLYSTIFSSRLQLNIRRRFEISSPITLNQRNFSSKYDDEDEFSGTVPLDEISITYSKSSGTGGQNVNKVNTKVEMRFHVESAEWIPQWIRNQILTKESSKITKDGYLIIRSEAYRTQLANQEDCIMKIKTIIYNNSAKPYQPTAEEIRIKERRIKKAKEKVLEGKRQKAMKKQNRQRPGYGD